MHCESIVKSVNKATATDDVQGLQALEQKHVQGGGEQCSHLIHY